MSTDLKLWVARYSDGYKYFLGISLDDMPIEVWCRMKSSSECIPDESNVKNISIGCWVMEKYHEL